MILTFWLLWLSGAELGPDNYHTLDIKNLNNNFDMLIKFIDVYTVAVLLITRTLCCNNATPFLGMQVQNVLVPLLCHMIRRTVLN
jgi:hypothetical protein